MINKKKTNTVYDDTSRPQGSAFRKTGCCPGGGGGTPYMTGVGMLVFSLRGIDFGFWSRLGCSGQNNVIFSRKGLF